MDLSPQFDQTAAVCHQQTTEQSILQQGAGDPSNPTNSANSPPWNQETTATATAATRVVLNIRSCVTCRRRKVRCNKHNPCSNCVKAGIECVFPNHGRAPRKSRKAPEAELLARLKKLESVVHSLGANVDENGMTLGSPSAGARGGGGGGGGGGGAAAADTSNHDGDGLQVRGGGGGGGGGGATTTAAAATATATATEMAAPAPAPAGNTDQTPSSKRCSVDHQLGRLIISDDRSRYVSNQFWASMSDEIAEMRELLDVELTDDEDSDEPPTYDKFNSHQCFIFGYSSLMVDLQALHPPPSQIFILWEVFKDNVDPVLHLLHQPTVKKIFMNAASHVDHLSRPAEALLFSLYLGAVISLTDEQCHHLLDQSREFLTKKYRFAAEQALARADFLNSSSLTSLQAFTFFLIFVRHMDETRLVWALGGMAVHLAQVLGIHRDGTHFGLTPFDTEMRRRLWWHISIVDSRAAEEHGTDPMFSERFYDTRMPLNVNDEDLYPDMKTPPKEREGATEMTFSLIRFELIAFNRRLRAIPQDTGSDQQILEEKEKMIDACHRKIEDKYLRHSDMSNPIFWVCATVARLILAKTWLMVYHPRSVSMTPWGRMLPNQTRDRLFMTAVEVIEFACLLQTNENTAKWAWLFRTYMQWQSVAFVLTEICQRPPSPEVERAWRAVECIYDPGFSEEPRTVKGMLWKPIRQLMIKARAIHSQQRQQHQQVKKNQRANSTPSHTDTSDSGPPGLELEQWQTNFPHATVLSESAYALDMDLLSPDPPVTASRQMPADTKATAMRQNMNGETVTAGFEMMSPPNMDQNILLNWTASPSNAGDSFSPEQSEPVLHFFQAVQQEWF